MREAVTAAHSTAGTAKIAGKVPLQNSITGQARQGWGNTSCNLPQEGMSAQGQECCTTDTTDVQACGKD